MKKKDKRNLIIGAALVVAGTIVSEAGAFNTQPAAIVKAGWTNTPVAVEQVVVENKAEVKVKRKGLIADVAEVYKFWYAK